MGLPIHRGKRGHGRASWWKRSRPGRHDSRGIPRASWLHHHHHEPATYYGGDHIFPSGLWAQTEEAISHVEAATGKQFGGLAKPLLFSVRSGAAVSMPGMMDTILNLGLNDETVEGLAKLTGDEVFAWDSYRRFVQMFGEIVFGVPRERMQSIVE